jgi:hypothetical protein
MNSEMNRALHCTVTVLISRHKTQLLPIFLFDVLNFESRAHPREIMTEVLKALQELNVYWKKIGHYNVKCRWTRNIPGQNETMLNLDHGFTEETGIIENDACGGANLENVVKFELQVSCFFLFSLEKTFVQIKDQKE